MLYTGTTCWGKVRRFWDSYTEEIINVVDYSDGTVTFGETSLDIYTYIFILVRCFEERWGFAKELQKSYCMQEEITVKEIRFEYKGIWQTLTPDDCDVQRIVRRWNAAYEKAQADAYEESLRKDITEIVSQEVFCFKSEEAKRIYEDWVKDYTCDGRKHSVVAFSERWANYMQYLVREQDKSVYFIARKTFDECKSPLFNETITSSLAGDVINILMRTWKYGDELREWNNTSTKYFRV